MAIENSILNAQILSAQLGANLGAIDAPESIVTDLLGVNVYAGQQVFDTVAGGTVEVVSVGTKTVSVD